MGILTPRARKLWTPSDAAVCPRCGKIRREHYRRNRHRLGFFGVVAAVCCCEEPTPPDVPCLSGSQLVLRVNGVTACSGCVDCGAGRVSNVSVAGFNGSEFLVSYFNTIFSSRVGEAVCTFFSMGGSPTYSVKTHVTNDCSDAGIDSGSVGFWTVYISATTKKVRHVSCDSSDIFGTAFWWIGTEDVGESVPNGACGDDTWDNGVGNIVKLVTSGGSVEVDVPEGI